MKKHQISKNINKIKDVHLINEDNDDIALYIKAKNEFKKNSKTYSLEELKSMYNLK